MWYVYVIQSLRNRKNYVGITGDFERRFSEHNSGEGGQYSSRNRPFKLIYYEAFVEKKDAMVGEKFYKSGYGREVLKGKLKHYLSLTDTDQPLRPVRR